MVLLPSLDPAGSHRPTYFCQDLMGKPTAFPAPWSQQVDAAGVDDAGFEAAGDGAAEFDADASVDADVQVDAEVEICTDHDVHCPDPSLHGVTSSSQHECHDQWLSTPEGFVGQLL